MDFPSLLTDRQKQDSLDTVNLRQSRASSLSSLFLLLSLFPRSIFCPVCSKDLILKLWVLRKLSEKRKRVLLWEFLLCSPDLSVWRKVRPLYIVSCFWTPFHLSGWFSLSGLSIFAYLCFFLCFWCISSSGFLFVCVLLLCFFPNFEDLFLWSMSKFSAILFRSFCLVSFSCASASHVVYVLATLGFSLTFFQLWFCISSLLSEGPWRSNCNLIRGSGFYTHWPFLLLFIPFLFVYCRMGVISRKIFPACESMCVCCPALRSRSRQPVKRYKKLLAEIFPKTPVSFTPLFQHLLS